MNNKRKDLREEHFLSALILKRMGSGMTTKPQDVLPKLVQLKISVRSTRELPTAGHSDRTELSIMISIAGSNKSQGRNPGGLEVPELVSFPWSGVPSELLGEDFAGRIGFDEGMNA